MLKFFLIYLLLSSYVFADYIIKYKDGRSVISKINPAELLSISSNGDEIDYIEEDVTLFAHSYSSNDTLFNQQWALSNYLDYSFQRAKQYESSTVNVAVIDTGITPHPDLDSIIISGLDFISDSKNGRDSNGRDSDPTDMGDYSSSDCQNASSSSTWHGTHISGIIAAVSNNNYGVSGASTKVKIQPLRVLGPCGGQTSDIADAIRWAAGGSVSGLGQNPNPVKVINLSLGGKSTCSSYMQEAINYANSVGAVVVASAGNDGASVDSMEYTPVNCKGVFRVGAVNSSIYQSNYSNYGEIVDISAPGDVIYSTVNSGSQTQSSPSFKSMSGTSMSTGFVSSLVATLFSVNPSLSADQVKDIIVRTSYSLYCRNYNCSKGAIDPYQAVLEAVDEVYDPNFKYSDPVVVGGFQSASENLVSQSTSGGGGGLCGTINFVDKDDKGNKGDGNLSKTLFLLLSLIIFHYLLGNFFKIHTRD